MVTEPPLAFSKGLRHKAGMVGRGKSAPQRLREFQGQLRKMLPLVERLLEAGEVQEPAGAYTASQEARAARPVDSRYRIEPYGRRNHALYDGEELVAVMAYKRGAVEVKRRFETLEQGDRPAETGAHRKRERASRGGAARGCCGSAPGCTRSWE